MSAAVAMKPHMTRLAFICLTLATLTALPACQRKPTTVPEAPAAKPDFAPPEEYELASEGGGGGSDEEVAPGLGGG